MIMPKVLFFVPQRSRQRFSASPSAVPTMPAPIATCTAAFLFACVPKKKSTQLQQAQRYAAHIHRVFLGRWQCFEAAHGTVFGYFSTNSCCCQKYAAFRYAGPKDMLRKTPEELISLRQAGLKLVYYGMESGDDAVLAHVNKGVTAAESIEVLGSAPSPQALSFR